ncbi:hypothetical protein L7F22_055928 [Adiantum nelumboides]|nr:hypothetical protein [Adiantum nelumboides]
MFSEAQRKRMEENRAAALARFKSRTDSQAPIGLQTTNNQPTYDSQSVASTHSFSKTEISHLGGPLLLIQDRPNNTENFSTYNQKTPYYVGHNQQPYSKNDNHLTNHSIQINENHVPIHLQQNSSLCGPGPISHKNYLMEADRRYPARKKTRTNGDAWVPSGQCNRECEPYYMGKPHSPLNCVKVSLELQAFDRFSALILNPSDAARDILSRLVASVSPLLEASDSSSVLYHVKDYKNVLCFLRDTPGVVLQHIPESTFSIIQKMHHVKCSPQHWVPFMPNHISDAVVDELMQQLPCKLKETLLPFQLEGVKYALRRGGRCLIADEMGVGKTIQAISLAACYSKEGSILITCPASLRLMWAEELERWLPFMSPVDVHLVFGHKTRIPDGAKTPRVVVISYTMLRRLKKHMMARKWALLIVDESHNLRCTRSKVECEETTAILEIAQNIKRIVLLSGTPSLSRPFDIFHQINILSPGLLGRSKYEFAKLYCVSESSTEGQQALWPKARQDWGTGRLELSPHKGIGKKTKVVRYNMKTGKQGKMEFETSANDFSSFGYSTTTEEESTTSEESDSSGEEEMGLILTEPNKVDLLDIPRVEESKLAKILAKDLTEKEKQAYLTMLEDFPRLFIEGYDQITRVTVVQHHINLKEGSFIYPVEDSESRVGLSSSSNPKDVESSTRTNLAGFLTHRCYEKKLKVRRLKDDVLAQLPPKRRQVIRLTLEASDISDAKCLQNTRNKKKKESLCKCGFAPQGCCDCEDEDEGEGGQIDHLPGAGKVDTCAFSYQEIGVAKVRGVCEWLSNHPLLSDDSDDVSRVETDKRVPKILIFGHHLKVLDSLQEMIHTKGLEYVRVDGSTLTTDRQKAVNAFKMENKIKVALIGLTAGGVGLDFSSAQTVVFAELPKSSSELIQAEDRAHRRGQTSAVNVYFFCAKNTSDEMQWQRLSKSLERVSTMTNGSEDAIAGLEVDKVLGNLNKEVTSSQHSSEDKEHRLTKDENSSRDAHSFGMQSKGSAVDKVEAKKDDLAVSTGVELHGHEEVEKIGLKGCIAKDDEVRPGTGNVNNAKKLNGVPHQTSLMFEVSANTGRIHIYTRSDSDGFRPKPLHVNFLPEDLELLNDPSEPKRSRNVLDCFDKSPSNLKCATDFLQQWNSLRPVDQNSLLGRPLQLPLAFELECNKADNGLVKGGSKRRVTPISEISVNMPEDAILRKIILNRHSFKDKHAQQAWSSNDEPLCKLCYSPCLTINAKSPEYFEDLFCRQECYEQFRIKTSQGYIRQELFALEKGVCALCKLDCHALVEKIRPLPHDQRRKHILRQAPQFKDNHRLLEKLVSDAKEGNAWHADHIVAVHQGGGECTLHNMRTLCVICHAKVTIEQNRKRRKSFNRAKNEFQATIEKFIENWCEKRMQATAPQDADVKLQFGDESSEDEGDSDILNIEITGSIYSKKEETKKKS